MASSLDSPCHRGSEEFLPCRQPPPNRRFSIFSGTPFLLVRSFSARWAGSSLLGVRLATGAHSAFPAASSPRLKLASARMSQDLVPFKYRPLPLVFQTSQGATPPVQRFSSCCLSLNVSMLAQKPSYVYPISCFSSTKRRNGSFTSSSFSRM